jgi:branched-chain amino acid transport system substrate-binding protein
VILLGVAMIAAACGGSSNKASTSATTAKDNLKEETIKIGALQSQTGSFGTAGTAGLGGTKVGIAMVNEAGGVVIGGTRYKFSLVSQDSATDPAKAAAGAQALLRDEQVKFLFGPIETPSLRAVEPLVKGNANVLWVGGSTYLPGELEKTKATGGYETSFGTNPSAASVYPASVKGALEFIPGVKTAALLWPAGAGLDPFADMIVKSFTDAGVTVVETLRYDATATDFTPLLTRIKAKNPDILYTGTAAGSVQAIITQASSLGGAFKALIAQGTSVGLGLTGDNGKPTTFPYLYLVNRAADRAISPYVAELGAKYTTVNGKAPEPDVEIYAVEFTGPVLALAAAMKKAGTVTDLTKIAKAMTEVKVKSFTGEIGFNANHVWDAPIAVCQVVSSKTTCKLEGQAGVK